MFRRKSPSVSIALARTALESIFNDCDKFDADETGGRLLGTYSNRDGRLEIQVSDVLEAGPQAQRSRTFFQQDGDYQERRFREIEAEQPDIEHLGNWHTHHVNGHPTLSGGDCETYHRIVNHHMHNTDFFYALLVVSRNRGRGARYVVKHFLFRRGDSNFYEIPERDVQIIDLPARRAAISTRASEPPHSRPDRPAPEPNLERAKDQGFFSEFYPEMKALMSKDTGAVYWKGPVALIDGSEVTVVAAEDAKGGVSPSYSIVTSCRNPAVSEIVTQYQARQFRSAREAVFHLERDLNRALFQERRRQLA